MGYYGALTKMFSMARQELLEYIQRQLDSHTRPAHIRTKLLGNGWNAGAIDAAFLHIAHVSVLPKKNAILGPVIGILVFVVTILMAILLGFR